MQPLHTPTASVLVNEEENYDQLNESQQPPPGKNERFASKWSLIYACFLAIRPWTLGSSFISALLGSVLGARAVGQLDIASLLVTLVTIACVHASGNLLNTFYDYWRGVDTSEADDQTLVSGALLPEEVSQLCLSCYSVSLCCYFLLTMVSEARAEHLALIFFTGISGSIMYSAGDSGFKYQGPGAGELALLFCFGPVTLLFAWLSQGAPLSLTPVPYVFLLSFHLESRLHSNNVRDVAVDKRAHLVTLASCLGHGANYLLFVSALFLPYFGLLVLTVACSVAFLLPLSTIPMALRAELLYRKKELQQVPALISKLSFIFGLLFTAVVAVLPKDNLPFAL